MNLSPALRRLLPVLLLALTLLAPVPAHAQSGMSTVYPAATPDSTYPLDIGGRTARVSVPPGATGPRPLILAFGGWGTSPTDMAADTGLRNVSDALIVYPQGVTAAWAGAPYSRTTHDEDVAHVRALVDAVAARHPVDRSRIYAVGHSNGGGMAAILACRAPDLVAGVAVVSGMFYDAVDRGCVGAPVPVTFIHALNDDVSRLGGGVRHGAHFTPVGEIVERWRQRNGCHPLPALDVTPAVLLRQNFQGCHADTRYVLSAVSGHQWPAHAAGEAWDFLSRQNR